MKKSPVTFSLFPLSSVSCFLLSLIHSHHPLPLLQSSVFTYVCVVVRGNDRKVVCQIARSLSLYLHRVSELKVVVRRAIECARRESANSALAQSRRHEDGEEVRRARKTLETFCFCALTLAAKLKRVSRALSTTFHFLTRAKVFTNRAAC